MSDAQKIIEILQSEYPDAHCELDYGDEFQLLVAVILSAQCTDKRVNKVTPALFERAGNPYLMADMEQEELEKYIFSCGFYRNKAKNILSMSKELIERFDGKVPNNLEKLQTLAGVGRKTANVVYSEAFNGDAIAVDTHVLRVSNRLGFVKTENPYVCEKALMEKFEKKEWGKLHLQLVHFGRYKCKAIKPECETCPFTEICLYYKNLNI